MSTTLLELTRAAHERVERLERAVAKHLRTEPRTQTDRLRQNHQIRGAINQMADTTRRLIEIYSDEDGARRDEIAALAGHGHYTNSCNHNNAFVEFYDRLKEIRDHHSHHSSPAICQDDDDGVDEEWTKDDRQLELMFSGEEAMGRYLDLHQLHNAFVNLPRSRPAKVDYSDYLGQLLAQPIPSGPKGPRRDYLRKLVDYLAGFLDRTQPLLDLEKVLNREIGSPIEAKTIKLCKILSEVISRTKERVDRKLVSTYDEIGREKEEEEDFSESSAEVEDGEEITRLYNPKSLPVGWDGRPIPYWLYKLHGLGFEFRCEICGGEAYRGRRAYERHFREARHRAGLRSLGIANSKDMYEVASIEEAKRLWDVVEERRTSKRWRPEVDEEHEDKEGNVYRGRTYADMKRQGLI